MGTVKIAVLMTGAAFFRGHAVTLSATPYIHGMGVSIIALPGKVSRRMAVHTSRVPQDGDERREERSVSICRRGSGAILRWWFCCRNGMDETHYNADGENRSRAGEVWSDRPKEALHTASDRRMGNRWTRFPVAANRALAIAGAAQGTPGSPIPPDFSLLSTM